MAVNIKVGPMDGAELVAHTSWARQRPGMVGATEIGICKSCRQPFLFNGHVLMPETCGRERCMVAADEHVDLRVLTKGVTPPAAPPKTRRVPVRRETAEPGPTEPVCNCICHLNTNTTGLVSDSAQDTCNHCCV